VSRDAPTSARQRFAALFRELRTASGLSYRDLERPTLATRGWISNVASGARWPDRSWTERADSALNASGQLVTAWDAGEAEREQEKRAKSLLTLSVKSSEEIYQAAATDNADVDTLNDAVASLSVAYLRSPATPMLEQAMALRTEALRRLKDGAVRPHELADLYLAAGRASGVLSYAALDLGDPDGATTHARTAWRLADLASDDELRAWVRGTQSLIERFAKNYDKAAALISDGMKYAGPGTSTIRLLCGAAQCAANAGDSAAAQAFLDEALRAREHAQPDSVCGLFAFSRAKQLYYAGSSLMWLHDTPALQRAERDSGEAIAVWQHEGEQFRSLDDEALAHVYMATARLKLGEIEGAMDAVRPIIELPPERQTSWIRRRVSELSELLVGSHLSRSCVVRDARDELRAYAT
jgi:tetratricopeptide (TPR) repeat protein